jgi:hypothetical protein
MKLSVKCDVESDVILTRRLELKTEDLTLCFEVDKQGRWILIELRAQLADPSQMKWGLQPVPDPRSWNEAPYNVVGEFEPRLYENVIQKLQALESTLSVFFPVRSVNWRYPTVAVIFEEGDSEDPNMRDLQSIRLGRQKLGPIKASEKPFVQIIGLALKSQPLVIIESFWREGENDWVSGKFINAFFNFYFVLEGLYGQRNTKNRLVKKAFLASEELKTSIQAFLVDQHAMDPLTQLVKMVNVGDRLPTAEELVGLLVSTRGTLHHFQNNPNRRQGSPLVHDEYHGIAYLARSLAHKGILAEAVRIGPVQFTERKPSQIL